MSRIPLLPTYYIGTKKSIDDIMEDKHSVHGEWHWYSTSETPTPNEPVWVILKDSSAYPHPDWVELPHLLDQTPVHTHLLNNTLPHIQAALKSGMTTPTDTTYQMAVKVHKYMPCFKP